MLPLLAACESTMPSARLQSKITLPVPASASALPDVDRFARVDRGESYRLSPHSLITIAFDRQPEIKSSFHRFESEEARYDFFYTSRDSLTPRLRTSNQFGEDRDNGAEDPVTRTRSHTVELSIEKQFFDTTALNMSMGFQADAVDEALGNHPFVSASLRYPLWASREKLERTSEEIFWKNRVDDAQLGYIQLVRSRLEQTLFKFYDVVNLRRQVQNSEKWLRDLEALRERLKAERDPNRAADRQRVEAEIASVTANVRNTTSRYDVDMEHLKAACGLPFHAEIELADEPFNPFEGLEHDELFRLSIETDPEIATLRNAKRNAEVQLDLARRGRWDIALLMDGTSSLEGGGEHEGVSDWSVSAGLDVSVVDPRVTDSLIRQAEANIARFNQAIVAREDEVYVDTFEPLLRMQRLGESRDELLGNLPRYQTDYDNGMTEYFAGSLNIDDLLKRRETLFYQEQEVSHLTYMVGANVAELCAATGKFFELLNGPPDG